jgi:hypothetical protein
MPPALKSASCALHTENAAHLRRAGILTTGPAGPPVTSTVVNLPSGPRVIEGGTRNVLVTTLDDVSSTTLTADLEVSR